MRCATPITRATVDLAIQNNASWEDAFTFGTAGDTTWSLTGQDFRMDVKVSRDAPAALLTLSTVNGRIVVDDVTQRIIHFNVDDATITASLIPGTYVYDLIMYDASSPAVRTVLMGGEVCVIQGVTGD